MKDRAEATRQRLLEAAEAVFAEFGFYRASISELTRRARVAQGTFYVHFRTKEEIFRELVRQLSHDLRRELQEAVVPLVDRKDAERVGFETFLSFVLRRRNLYSVLRECESVDPELYQWYYERLAEGYVRGLRQAMAREQIRRLNPEAIAYALMGLFQMVGMRWSLWQRTMPPEDVLESIASFVLHGLDPAEERPPGETTSDATVPLEGEG